MGIAFLATGARAERIWPGEGVEAVAGTCATATVGADETVLRAAPTCPATVWPAVYFTFSAERDLPSLSNGKCTVRDGA